MPLYHIRQLFTVGGISIVVVVVMLLLPREPATTTHAFILPDATCHSRCQLTSPWPWTGPLTTTNKLVQPDTIKNIYGPSSLSTSSGITSCWATSSPTAAAAVGVASDVSSQSKQNDDDDDDDDAVDTSNPTEEEQEVLLQFIQYCQDTPIGDLEMDDAHLLRSIMNDYPFVPMFDKDTIHTDYYSSSSSSPLVLDPAIMIESLLFRLLDEWKDTFNVMNDHHDKKDNDNEVVAVVAAKEVAFRPTCQDFDRAIEAWHNSANPDKVVRVLSLLSDQRTLTLDGSKVKGRNNSNVANLVRPTLHTVKLVLRTLAQSKERGLDKRGRMVFNSLQMDYNLHPDAEIYGLLAQIEARSRTRGAAQRAETLLREAIERFPHPGPGLGTDVFNTVVTAYAKSGEGEEGPKRAHDLIVWMDQLDANTGGTGIHAPNSHTFTSLIDAYAQTNEWDSVQEAEKILNRLLSQHLKGEEEEDKVPDNDLEPNVATWTIVISAWARMSKKNRNGAARRAGKLLRRMEDLYLEKKISFPPDAITYVTCMNAFAFSNDVSDVAEAERLLEEMNELWLDGNDSMKPSLRSIKILIDAWIKLENMENAEDVLQKYEDIVENDPNADSQWWEEVNRAFLLGYAKQDDPRRATVYLNVMIEEEGMEPDAICYDKIIESYTKLGKDADCAKRAQDIFQLMERRREAGAFRPNERIYTSFIRALTKGRVPGLHKKAELLLRRMRALYDDGNRDIQPTSFTYNAVLNACADSVHVEGANLMDAFQTSVKVFTELRKETNPDQVTFGNMVRCANLLSPSEQKDKFLMATFQLCCDQGLVNALVLRDLRRAASDDIWTSLTGLPLIDEEEVQSLDMEKFPRDWTRNIIDRKPLSNPKPSYPKRDGRNEGERRGGGRGSTSFRKR
jgi:tetratricopeptide (TPR) repeat protein